MNNYNCNYHSNNNCNSCYCNKNQNYYCCPIWIKGETGPIGPTGPTGSIGPTGSTGPLAPQSFVQLFDRNFTNELSSNTNLNLSNLGINPAYSTGEYTLSTTTVTNDTLNLPGPGLYNISIYLRASFLQPVNPGDTFGTPFQIIFDILNENTQNVNNLNYIGIISKDPDFTTEATLSTEFLYNATGSTPSLKIALSNFQFNLAFENKLSVFDIIFIVQKWEKP